MIYFVQRKSKPGQRSHLLPLSPNRKRLNVSEDEITVLPKHSPLFKVRPIHRKP